MATQIQRESYLDKNKQREIRHILSDLGLCSCGTEGGYGIVHAMLERAAAKHSSLFPLSLPGFYDAMYELDLSARAVEFIAKVMDSRKWGLLAHGSSIGPAWLTPKGHTLLVFFRVFGSNDEDWPEWWCSCDAKEEW